MNKEIDPLVLMDPVWSILIAVSMPALMLIGGVILFREIYQKGLTMSDDIVVATGLIVISLALYFKYFY